MESLVDHLAAKENDSFDRKRSSVETYLELQITHYLRFSHWWEFGIKDGASRGVTRLDGAPGARSNFGDLMFEPEVSRKQIYCIEGSTGEIVGTFRRLPQSFRAELCVGPGSGLSLSKCLGPISGLHTQAFYTIQSNNFFFLELHLLFSPQRLLWVKWFSSANPICKHSCFLMFSAQISLTLFITRRQCWRWCCYRSITYSILGLFSTNRLFMPIALYCFYAHSAIVDNFATVCLILRHITFRSIIID